MKRSTLLSASLLAAAMAGCSAMQQSDDGWTTLLEGASGLEYWDRFGTANWGVVDGIVQANKSDKGAGYLVSKASYTDFVIRVEFWASDGANSGIFMRCADRGNITDKTCYEANIFDQRPDPSYGTGAIVHHAKIANMPKAGGKWNVYEITAKGPKFTVVLNGEKTVELEHDQLKSGPVALQWGQGVIKFRKVQIKRI